MQGSVASSALVTVTALVLCACGVVDHGDAGAARRSSPTTSTVTVSAIPRPGATAVPKPTSTAPLPPALTSDGTVLVSSGVSADGPWSLRIAPDFSKVVVIVSGETGGSSGGDVHTPCLSSLHPVALLYEARGRADSYVVGLVDPAADVVRLELSGGADLVTPVLRVSQFPRTGFFAAAVLGGSPEMQGMTAVYPNGNAVTVGFAGKQHVFSCS